MTRAGTQLTLRADHVVELSVRPIERRRAIR